MKPEHKRYILENIDKKTVGEIARDLNLKEERIKKFLQRENKGLDRTYPKPETRRPAKRRAILLSLALIIVLGFSIYANSLKGSFLWDDEGLIEENTHIRSFSNIPKIFTQDIAAGGIRLGAARKVCFSYRPLQMFTYMLDYSLWRLDTKGYHLSSLLLHILVALCIYWLISIVFGDSLLALLGSIFFIAHPVHTGAVTYLSGRADPLAGLFILLGLILYIKAIHGKGRFSFILTVVCYTAALLSRENSLIFPFLILLYHYSFRERVDLKQLGLILCMAILYILLRVTVLQSLLPHVSSTTTIWQRIPGFFAAITDYVRLLVLPSNLHMEYGDGLFKFTHPKTLLGILIFFSLIIYAFKKRDTNRLIFFSVCWFFLTLLPSSNIYPVKAYMAEHWLYLPSLGFFLILAKILHHLCQIKGFKTFTIIPIAGLLVFYSYLTVKQNTYWREPFAFYERMLRYAPRSTKLYYNLANRYKDTGEYQRAIELYQKSLEIEPYFVDSYINLGSAYNAIGRDEEAIALYKKAIGLNPNYAGVYYNLGNTYKTIGKYDDAIASYKKAIEIIPDYANAYNNLGNLYREMGRREEAIDAYRKVLEIDPNFAYAYNNLGLIYYEIGEKGKALDLYEKAIEIEPGYAQAYNNFAMAYYNMGKHKEAIDLFKKAIELNPGYATAYFNLSVAYCRLKQFDVAIKYCDKAVELGYKVSPEFLELLKPYR